MSATLYEPTNVYKPVAPRIGIVDGPFEYLTVLGLKMPMPFTTRMTVVRLTNGDLFSPLPDTVPAAARRRSGSCPEEWCNCGEVTAIAGVGRTGQLARAGRLTMGSSLNGAMVSSVM